MRTALLLFASSAALCTAAPKELPNRVVSESKFKTEEAQTATLPKLLRDALLMQDEFSQGTDRLPDTLFVRRYDLNGDGSIEYIVDSRQSYSGGTAHVIFERRKKSYESIGYFQGGILYLAAPANGYHQICVRIREGSYVLRFTGGEYRPIR